MSGAADDALDAALRAALADGPLDVLGLLERLRRQAPRLLAGREGLLHAALHRLERGARVRVAGASAAGLPQYAWNGHGTPEVAADWGPRAGADDGVAVGVSRAVRDATTRVRVLVNVAAHRAALPAAERERAFGSPRAAYAFLRRVDRRQRTVLLATDAGGHLRRFLVHEGPWILGAVLLFLTVKLFFADVFVIPSPSMVPTLALGDRVVVVKRGGGWRPERWQVVTFRHRGPDGPDSVYVKRVVGLPGEEVSIWHGDVYADGALLVKPEALSALLRRPVQAWDLAPGFEAARWQSTPLSGGGLRHVPADDPLRGGSGAASGLLDVYLELDLEVSGEPDGGGAGGEPSEGMLVLTRSGGPSAGATTFLLGAGPAGLTLSRSVQGPTAGALPRVERLASAPPRLGRMTLSLSVIDGVARAGAPGLSWSSAEPLGAWGASLELVWKGRAVRPLALRLDQDLHYTRQGSFAVGGSDTGPDGLRHRVAEDALFLLGDNTTNSHDSREPDMGDIRLERLVGPVVFRIWPVGRIGEVR